MTKQYAFILAAISLCVLFAHVWHIDQVPRGLYQDESAIGLNGLLIAETGKDEYGTSFPLYFESFGDYKNPLHIYSAALLFSIIGPSITALRLVSAFYFLVFYAAFVGLVWSVSRHKEAVTILAAISAGFLPWIFTLSRTAFDVIGQLALIAVGILCAFHAFRTTRTHRSILLAVMTGLSMGLSIYAYMTGRLFAALLLFCMLLLYARRDTWRTALCMISAFAISAVPYLLYSIAHPNQITARFRSVTYVYDPSLSATEKLMKYAQQYVSHFHLDFLLLSGDANARHATHMGGQVFIVICLLAIVGVAFAILRQRIWPKKILLLLSFLVLLAPSLSAITIDGVPHGIRSALLAMGFLLFACYGLDAVLTEVLPRRRVVVSTVIIGVLVLESALYVRDYFVRYPAMSAIAFESYYVEQGIRDAIAYKPVSIVVTPQVNTANVRFYARVIPNIDAIPIDSLDPEPMPGRCIISGHNERDRLDASQLAYRDLSQDGGTVDVRCYSK